MLYWAAESISVFTISACTRGEKRKKLESVLYGELDQELKFVLKKKGGKKYHPESPSENTVVMICIYQQLKENHWFPLIFILVKE